MDRPAPVNVHPSLEALEDKTCLVMDDDGPFVQRLARALAQRGFVVSAVSTVAEGKDIARLNPPAFAVLDLRLEDGSGLEVAPRRETLMGRASLRLKQRIARRLRFQPWFRGHGRSLFERATIFAASSTLPPRATRSSIAPSTVPIWFSSSPSSAVK
jgi:hypothetical protein